MTRKTLPPPKVRTVLLVPLDQARERVYRQLEKGSEILKIEIKTEEELHQAEARHSSWSDHTGELLRQMFNTEELVRKFTGSFGAAFFGDGKPPLDKDIQAFRGDVQKDLERLAVVYEQLESFPVSPADPAQPEGTSLPPEPAPRSPSVTIDNYGTIYNPQTRQPTSKPSPEIIGAGASATIQPLLRQLTRAVENMSLALPKESARQVNQDLSVFAGEASSSSPRKEWWQLSADSLKKSAASVGAVGKPVTELVTRIMPLLVASSKAK